MAHEVDQVAGVAPIQHRERRIEPGVAGELAQQAVGDRVERARPGKPNARAAAGVTERLAHDALGAAHHLRGRPARERQ